MIVHVEFFSSKLYTHKKPSKSRMCVANESYHKYSSLVDTSFMCFELKRIIRIED
jgi:hypothetical protein